MRSVTITGLTKKGEDALRIHWEESRKLRLIHKVTFRSMGYSQEVIKEKPFTLRLNINNKYFQQLLTPEKFIPEIENTLIKNGANKEDFKIENE